MRKNLSVVASILLVIGGLALWWVLAERKKDSDQAAHYESQCSTGTDEHVRQYDEWLQTPPQERPELPLLLDAGGKTKTREQLWQEQQVRLKADLDRLAAGEITAPPSFTDVLYGENWQTELSEYKKRKERQASVFTGSLVCMSMGGLIHAWWVLWRAGRLFGKVGSDLKRSFGRRDGTAEQSDQAAPEPADAEDVPAKPESDEPEGRPARLASISVKPVTPSDGEPERKCMGSVTQRRGPARARERAIELASDDKSRNVEAPTAEATKCQLVREQARPLDGKDDRELEETTDLTSEEESGDAKTPAAGATKRQSIGEDSKPIDNTLNDLTQQVSAIREYAANQQNRLEKLQDGYDWNIIRTFCLRVIRAVDNLESRIARFKEDNVETTYLEEVRDELIFALESSGIEQFEPEMDSEYRGQEKLAEAVKEKQNCDNPEQAGRIANVIRPGYQYFINEGNVKIVRPAQVRLYA